MDWGGENGRLDPFNETPEFSGLVAELPGRPEVHGERNVGHSAPGENVDLVAGGAGHDDFVPPGHEIGPQGLQIALDAPHSERVRHEVKNFERVLIHL